jgi:hypothetical protein
MKKLIFFLCLPLLLAACGAFSAALTDKDVLQYIKACNNIGAAADELKKMQSDDKAQSLITCAPCRARMEKAVQDAGYADMKAFVASEIRVYLALRAWTYAEITKLAGQLGQGVAAEDFCGIKDNVDHANRPQDMLRYCGQLQTYTGYLSHAGSLAVRLAEKLVRQGDIEAVGRHIDAIGAAQASAQRAELPSEPRTSDSNGNSNSSSNSNSGGGGHHHHHHH